MAVPMVCVWHMGVAMRDRFMLMPMAVLARRHRFMHMVMVPIVMSVSMFMLQRVMSVLVGMKFHQVQQHA